MAHELSFLTFLDPFFKKQRKLKQNFKKLQSELIPRVYVKRMTERLLAAGVIFFLSLSGIILRI